MKTTTTRTKKTTKKAAQGIAAIRALFKGAHAEGRAVMSHEEFLLSASLAGLTEKDIRGAISDDLLRKGMTGYWLKEAADPGALLVFKSALSASHDNDEQEAA